MIGVIGIHQGLFGRVTLFRTNQPVHVHAHPHVHALIKVEGTDGAYDVNGSRCPINNEQMVLINPWVPHANWRDENVPPITILALYLEAGWLVRGSGSHDAPAFHPAVGEGRCAHTRSRDQDRRDNCRCHHADGRS